eukprot:6126036-Ditylum_brightwellii.AAC.1
MQHWQHEERRNTTESAETVAAAPDQMKPLLPHIYSPVAATPGQMETSWQILLLMRSAYLKKQ